MIDHIVHTEGNLPVPAVDRTGRSIHQMLNRKMTAGFQNVVEADDVGFHVGIRVINGITDTGLRGQVYDNVRMPGFENPADSIPVREISPDEDMTGRGRLGLLFNQGEAVFLQRRIIIVVHAVKADHSAAMELFQQPENQIGADEAGRPGDKNGFPL